MVWNGWFSRRLEQRERMHRSVLKLERLEERLVLDGTYFALSEGNFSQDWSNAGLITANDNWAGVPSILGYRGDGMVPDAGFDPQTIVGDGSDTPIDVNANQTNPNTFTAGGVTEFAIANPVVALQGNGTARVPHLILFLDTTGRTNVNVSYLLRDIDGSADNSVQRVALQYRVGTSNAGEFTNLPDGFVADASRGPGLAAHETPISVTLPAAADNQPSVQIRILTTDAPGLTSDEWIGIDDILVTSTPFDTAPPTVSSIVRASANPTNASSVDYTLTFSEIVSGVDPGDFTLAGLSGASVTSVSAGPSATYTVTVNTGSGEGTLRLEVADDDTILDAAGNKLGGTGLGNGSFATGEAYTIDRTAPVVTNIVRAGSGATNAASVDFIITFNANVSGVGTADFALTTSGVSGASIASVTPAGPANAYTVTVNAGSGDGTIQLDLLDDDSITDAAGNKLGGSGLGNGTFIAGEIYTIDRTPPTVLSITRLSGNPTNAATVSFTVLFSQPVNGFDQSDLTLITSGLSGVSIAEILGSPTTPDWTVTVNTGSGDGTIRLDLIDDDSIADAAGNKLGGSGNGNGSFMTGEAYTIDRTAPTVLSITPLDPSPINATSVHYRVVFSEPVSGVNAASFPVQTTGLTAAGAVTVSGGGDTYTLTVDTGTGSGTVEMDVADNDIIKDLAGNLLYGPGSGTVFGPVYTIDRDAPTVFSIIPADANPTNAAAVTFTVRFAEAVTGVDAGDFALAELHGGVSGTIGTPSTSDGGLTWSVPVTGLAHTAPSAEFTINLIDDDSIHDAADNPLGGAGPDDFTAGNTFLLDQLAPVVSSIVRASASPTNATSVDFTVTFSEVVRDVDLNDFALTGLSGASIASVSAGPSATYTVTVSTGPGDGTLGLNLVDNDSITDATANALAGNGNFTGQAYDIDRTAPTVQSITRLSPTSLVTNSATVQFRVTFSESVTGFDLLDFRLNPTLVPPGTVVSDLTGSGSTYTVTVTTGADGVLDPQVLDDDTIKDTAGSALSGAFLTGGEVFAIDKTPPTAPSIILVGSNSTNAGCVTFDVRFNEAVTGVDASDFAVVTTGVSGAMITDVSFSSETYHVTVSSGTGSGILGLNLVDDDTIADSATNPLGGPGAGNGNATGPAFTIDRTPPTVSSIVRAATSPTNAAAVDFTVIFSESVSGVDAADFSVSGSVSSVSGSGTTWTVTLTPAGEGTVGLNVVDDDSIVDGVGNPLAAGFTGTAFYTIDRTAPAVTSIRRLTPLEPATNASAVTFEVKFSEPVTGVGLSDFALTGGSTAALGTVSGGGTTYQVSVSAGAADGTLGLNLVDDDSIHDDAGNALAGSFTGEVYTIDRVAPTVTSITDDVGGGPVSPGTPITYTVTFGEDVRDGTFNAADLTNAGSAAVSLGVVAETSPGVFTVRITPTGPGTVLLTIPAGASVEDAVGNLLAVPVSDDTTITAAYQPPVLTVVGDQGATEGTALTLPGLGTFIDPDGSTGGPFSFTIDWGDNTTADTGTPGAGTIAGQHTYADEGLYTVTVTVADANGGSDTESFQVDVANVGPTLTVAADQTINEDVPLTLTDVGLVTDPGFADTFTYTIDWGEGPVQGPFAATIDVPGGPGVPRRGSFDGSHTYGSPGVYTVTVTVTDDDLGSDSKTFRVTVNDTTSPAVMSVVRAGSSPTNAASVDYTVTFSEAVTGVGVEDFSPFVTGSLSGVGVTTVTRVSASVYTVTVAVGGGTGTLRLDVPASATVEDLGGNVLPLGFSGGEVYSIDRTAPSVVSITRAGSSPTNAANVDFTVTFSEAVTGVDPADFSVSGSAGGSVSGVSGSGTTWTITVRTGSDGPLGLNVVDDDTIADGVGNTLAAGASGAAFYTIDKTPPTVTAVDLVGPIATAAQDVQFEVTFSEPVTGVDPTDFSPDGHGDATVTGLSGSGTTWTVSVHPPADGPLRLMVLDDDSIRDAAGNSLPTWYPTNAYFYIDRTAPRVLYLLSADGYSTNADSVTFTVAYTEPVLGVDASDFSLVTSGLSGAAITGVTPRPSEQVFDVTVATGTGEGSLRLDVLADGTVKDTAGNGQVIGLRPGAVVLTDRVAPTVTSIIPLDPSPTAAATVHFQVTFREPVFGVDPSDFALSTAGVSGAGVSAVSGSGDTYTVTVSTGTGRGSIRLDVVNDGTITDALDNFLAAGFTAGEPYALDRPVDPAVVSLVPNDTGAPPTTAGAIRLRRGQDLTLTATVAEVGSSGARSVTFLQDGNPVGTIGLVGNVAQIVISGLRVGDYAFTARYDGDNKHLPGTSSPVRVEVETPNTLFVIQTYDDLTGRNESPRTATLIAALDAGKMNRTEVVMAILHTPEYYARAVRDAYERLLHRPPTVKELNARVGLLAAGQTVPQLEAWLMGTPEYFTRRGRTAAGFRAAVIHDLTAGVFSAATRRALAAGLRAAAPGGALTTQAARTRFVIALMSNAFGRTATVQSLFGRFLGRPADGRLRAFVSVLRFERGYDQVAAALLASATYAP